MAMPAVMLWMGLAGCDWLGPTVAKVIPALEVVNPSLAADPLPCDEPIPTPAIGSDCAISELTCGDVVEGNTENGNNNWGDEIYKNLFCTVERHHYDRAPEAVYALHVPENIQATVRLDSNCADLDVVAIAWEETDRCPTHRHAIHECEMDVSKGGGEIMVQTVDNAQRYLVGVDGKNGATGNFRLTVECRQYR